MEIISVNIITRAVDTSIMLYNVFIAEVVALLSLLSSTWLTAQKARNSSVSDGITILHFAARFPFPTAKRVVDQSIRQGVELIRRLSAIQNGWDPHRKEGQDGINNQQGKQFNLLYLDRDLAGKVSGWRRRIEFSRRTNQSRWRCRSWVPQRCGVVSGNNLVLLLQNTF